MIALAQAWRAGLTRRTQRAAMAREATRPAEAEPPEHHEFTVRELIRMAQSARAASESRG
ncbi:hypothetical protein [Methylobacterium frigidaeris]|uniref:Uncharacterized protein n=1 Tax=Methylobacterium frigidaeris TaxID=2038277 RepID=A0AA37M354_9HYPH|nr:hypothetical protein [Methylobacterium frigidaeris]PIK72881.1 hypothetical protein CS379_11545 [Methylobacterium frigidaeris]GJD60369.1 hypothetical protein MPEAHAMD_0505 [Methylobacterium frigidaeris]